MLLSNLASYMYPYWIITKTNIIEGYEFTARIKCESPQYNFFSYPFKVIQKPLSCESRLKLITGAQKKFEIPYINTSEKKALISGGAEQLNPDCPAF